eukprot:CAMPEP_0113311380 /NCGR_PEP_ID=MMETSP0010_2-20120614/8641_1 /TAXON_ID=216773 ORGANISM="Corethron hystrix, Strain 308" /NCGR_SAMPLE_ID=MMETSP0010_2 /ASSEMBLY_ACC=CAM_ASM_000155 /LENGTH=525 /DNA_ID=CAMNT_0000167009 /DNA_START=209 /DNA_END=1786 /DNA_ORIENTATION=- /assembly_acc=CAM_ASM_000155
MVYAYWMSGRHEEKAVFDLFFRTNPFHGEYTIFCGLDQVLRYVSSYRFSESDINYIRTLLPPPSDASRLPLHESFFNTYLAEMDCRSVRICAVSEGTVVFPREPLLRVEGPLGVCQLLETTLLTLVNYPSLVATNAARHVLAAGQGDGNRPAPQLLEFGLRRAQGPDGGYSASKYCLIGGFHATSNCMAGKLLGVPVRGTHAHSFVQTFASLDEVRGIAIDGINIMEKVLHYRNVVLGGSYLTTNDGELAAFISYASSFPKTFLCLIDTYDTLRSGVLNFVLVSLVLHDLGYIPLGIRLDSGDLAYLSLEVAAVFEEISERFHLPFFQNLSIVASNDINEEVLHALSKQPHSLTAFGIGTNLVTCQAQPALGCVYKLVEINGKPRIKLSQDIIKVTIPGKKRVYRLYGSKGGPLLDVLIGSDDEVPRVGEKILCRHPFMAQKRAHVVPTKVESLLNLVFDGGKGVVVEIGTIDQAREHVARQMKIMRSDILRDIHPSPYKVSVTDKLFTFLHDLWLDESPVKELS